MKKQYIIYYASAVRQQLESGVNLEDVEVDFRLSVLKPLHAQWLVNAYNFFASEKGNSQGVKKGKLLDWSMELLHCHQKTLLKLYINNCNIHTLRLYYYYFLQK